MPPVVVTSSDNSFRISVVDFALPGGPPTVQAIDAGLGGSCVTDSTATIAVAGSKTGVGDLIRLFDITGGGPVPMAAAAGIPGGFGGVGAIAINGRTVVVGEMNGGQIKVLDVTTAAAPRLVATVNTPAGSGSVNSLAFASPTVVVAGLSVGPPVCVRINIATSPPQVTPVALSAFDGIATVGSDGGGSFVVGDAGSSRVSRFTAAGVAAGTTLVAGFAGGVMSVDLQGAIAVAGAALLSGSSPEAARIDFGPTTPPATPTVTPFASGFTTGRSPCIAAFGGGFITLGAVVGTGFTALRLFDAATNPPTGLAQVDPSL